MKRIIITTITLVFLFVQAIAQETVYPAKEYKGLIFITGGTVHVGNGQVLKTQPLKSIMEKLWK